MSETDKYLDEVCKEIANIKERGRVRAELEAHILERKEEYMREGDDEITAELKAIENMGDASEIAKTFGELHSFIPLKHFAIAMNLLFFGFLLTSFYIDVLTLKLITQFVGSILVMTAFFMLRKSNNFMNAAFIFAVVGFLFSAWTEIYCVLPFYSETNDFLNYFNLFVGVALNIIKMFLMGFGLARFCEGKLKTRAMLTGVFYFCEYVNFLICVIDPQWLLPFGAIIMVTFLIIILVTIMKVKKYVVNNDVDVRMGRTGAAGVLIITAVMVLNIFLPSVASIAVAAFPPETISYSVKDINADEKRIDGIKNTILDECGDEKEKLSSVLEIMRYSDLLKMENAEVECQSDFDSFIDVVSVTALDSAERGYLFVYYELSDIFKAGSYNRAMQIKLSFPFLIQDENFDYINLCGDLRITPSYVHDLKPHSYVAGEEFKYLAGKSEQRGYVVVPITDSAYIPCMSFQYYIQGGKRSPLRLF